MAQWKKTELSILIPNYNNVCVDLVTCLQQQAEALGINYEIIVADDHSPQQESIRENEAINRLPYCRYIVKEQNTGSAATRNYLGTLSHYCWLLFLDCDIAIPSDDFLKRYVADGHDGVVNGGICILEDERLRSMRRPRNLTIRQRSVNNSNTGNSVPLTFSSSGQPSRSVTSTSASPEAATRMCCWGNS